MIETFLAAQEAFGARVHAVTDEQWALSTPCVEWDVTRLVEHMIDEHRWVAPLVHGLALDAAGSVVAGTRDEGSATGNWDVAAASSADTFSEEGALERTVALSTGPTEGAEYLRQLTVDLVVHGWDLQRAIGFDGELPDDAVEIALAMARDWGDLATTGVFAPARPVPEGASPLEELLARTGRDPRG